MTQDETSESILNAIIAQNWSDAILDSFTFLEQCRQPLTPDQKSMILRVAMYQHTLCSQEINQFLAFDIGIEKDIKRIQEADGIDDLLGT